MKSYCFFLFALSAAVASGVRDYIEKSCKLSQEEAERYSFSLQQLYKELQGTFTRQSADPKNIDLYRRLDTSEVWNLLTTANPLLVKYFKDVRSRFAELPKDMPSCTKAVKLSTDENVDTFCFLGVILRLLTFGISLDGYSFQPLMSLQITNESRRLLLAEKHFGTRITHGGHLAELLKMDILLMPHNNIADNNVLATLFQSMLDLRTVVIFTFNINVRQVTTTNNILASPPPYMNSERDFFWFKDKLYIDRTSLGMIMLRAWLELKAYVPDGRERRTYYDENLSVHDNYRKLYWLTKKILKGGKSWKMIALACAYDCLNHYVNLYKVKDIDLISLRETIINIILKYTDLVRMTLNIKPLLEQKTTQLSMRMNPGE